MDASDTRRGQPAVHRRFAARHAAAGWRGSAGDFGAGAAILIGDLLLAWTDEMLRASGLAPGAVWRGLGELDAMRTEVFSGQFLDLVGQASGASDVDSALRVVTYKSAKYTVERPLHLGAELASGRGRARPVPAAIQMIRVIQASWPPAARTGRRCARRSPATASRSASRSSCATTYSACSVIQRKPASRSSTTCARGSARSCSRSPGNGPAAAQTAVLDRALGDPLLSEQGARQVRAVITGTGALAECEAMIDRNVKDALSALDSAPITAESKSALADLAVAATARTD